MACSTARQCSGEAPCGLITCCWKTLSERRWSEDEFVKTTKKELSHWNLLIVSVKLVIVFLVLLIPLDGLCDHDVSTYAAVDINSSNDTADNDERYNRSFRVTYQLLFRLTPVTAVLGLCGNGVVLVVWSAETAFNPTTVLMDSLAVTDIVLLFVLLYHSLDLSTKAKLAPGWHGTVLLSAWHHCRRVTAHTTLGIVLTRWVAVRKCLRVHSLLTKRTVVVGYVLMLFWCLLSTIPSALDSSGHIDREHYFTFRNTEEELYLALPILLLVAFSVSLVCSVCSHRHICSLELHSQQAIGSARSSQFHQLLAAVMCVSITTVLAYPAGVLLRILQNRGRESFQSVCPRDC